jgi:hypothetical protein
LTEEKKNNPAGNLFFAFNVALLKNLAHVWKMDFSKIFFEVDTVDKCHGEVPTPHAVVVGQDFTAINIYVDFTLILRNLSLVEAIPALVALHYSTNVHYEKDGHLILELLQKQVCILSPEKGTHKPGKENYVQQSFEIQSYQQFIGNYLYKKAHSGAML